MHLTASTAISHTHCWIVAVVARARLIPSLYVLRLLLLDCMLQLLAVLLLPALLLSRTTCLVRTLLNWHCCCRCPCWTDDTISHTELMMSLSVMNWCWHFTHCADAVTLRVELMLSLSVLNWWCHYPFWIDAVISRTELMLSLSVLSCSYHFTHWVDAVTVTVRAELLLSFHALDWSCHCVCALNCCSHVNCLKPIEVVTHAITLTHRLRPIEWLVTHTTTLMLFEAERSSGVTCHHSYTVWSRLNGDIHQHSSHAVWSRFVV